MGAGSEMCYLEQTKYDAGEREEVGRCVSCGRQRETGSGEPSSIDGDDDGGGGAGGGGG